MGGSKNRPVNCADANTWLHGERAEPAGRPPEETHQGRIKGQGGRREVVQAWGQGEQRRRTKQPGKCPLRPEAGSEDAQETKRRHLDSRSRACMRSKGRRLTLNVRGCDPGNQAGEEGFAVERGHSDCSEEDEFEEERLEVEEKQGRCSNVGKKHAGSTPPAPVRRGVKRPQVRVALGSCFKGRGEQWQCQVKEHRSGCR